MNEDPPSPPYTYPLPSFQPKLFPTNFASSISLFSRHPFHRRRSITQTGQTQNVKSTLTSAVLCSTSALSLPDCLRQLLLQACVVSADLPPERHRHCSGGRRAKHLHRVSHTGLAGTANRIQSALAKFS